MQERVLTKERNGEGATGTEGFKWKGVDGVGCSDSAVMGALPPLPVTVSTYAVSPIRRFALS